MISTKWMGTMQTTKGKKVFIMSSDKWGQIDLFYVLGNKDRLFMFSDKWEQIIRVSVSGKQNPTLHDI